MSLFSFLKKKKGDELDIPPPPPNEMASDGAVGLVPRANIPPPPKINIPPMPAPKDNKIINEPEKEEGFPEFPLFPEQEAKEASQYKFEPIERESGVVHPMAQQVPTEIEKTPKEAAIPKPSPVRIDKDLKQSEELKKASERRHFLEEPIFVKTDQYQDMVKGINEINNTMKECDFIADSLNDIKNKKDKEFNKWRSNLEDMQRKVSLVEKSLFEVAK